MSDKPRSPRKVLIACCCLVIPSGTALIYLNTTIKHAFHVHKDDSVLYETNYIIGSSFVTHTDLLSEVPEHIDFRALSASTIVGMLAIASGVAGLCGVVLSLKTRLGGGHQAVRTLILNGIALLDGLISLAIFVLCVYAPLTSPSKQLWHYTDPRSTDKEHTYYNWACGMKSVIKAAKQTHQQDEGWGLALFFMVLLMSFVITLLFLGEVKLMKDRKALQPQTEGVELRQDGDTDPRETTEMHDPPPKYCGRNVETPTRAIDPAITAPSTSIQVLNLSV
ncbi:hypothetical protein Slin15195_G063020 [Septoria linicola]|uniref:Uncharacterized protein n=1 Tax=Septoria linicola TaxID=215465 RepID=A0A9Q9EL26_9PEZI|nr:hypothetical protein Slin15195_G063020 [Septoria linicola]